MIILLLILLVSCTKSEVISMPPQATDIDTVYTPKVKADTIKKIPIRFDVAIKDWEDYDID